MDTAKIELNSLGSQVNMNAYFRVEANQQATTEEFVATENGDIRNRSYATACSIIEGVELDDYLDIPTYIRRGVVLSEA